METSILSRPLIPLGLVGIGLALAMLHPVLVDRVGHVLVWYAWLAFVLVVLRQVMARLRRTAASLLTFVALLISFAFLAPHLGRVGLMIDGAMLRPKFARAAEALANASPDTVAEVNGRLLEISPGPPIRLFYEASSSPNDVTFGYVYDPSHLIARENWTQEEAGRRPPRALTNFSGYEPIACRHAFRDVYRCQMI